MDKGHKMITHANSAPFKIMEALAEFGPAHKEEMKVIFSGLNLGVTDTTLATTIARMKDQGFLAQKTFLTPAGLAELKRRGWKPKFEQQ